MCFFCDALVDQDYNRVTTQLLDCIVRIMAFDTDVLALVITTMRVLEGCDICLAFSRGKNFSYIAAHTIQLHLVRTGAKACCLSRPFQVVTQCPHSMVLERKLYGMFGDLYQT